MLYHIELEVMIQDNVENYLLTFRSPEDRQEALKTIALNEGRITIHDGVHVSYSRMGGQRYRAGQLKSQSLIILRNPDMVSTTLAVKDIDPRDSAVMTRVTALGASIDSVDKAEGRKVRSEEDIADELHRVNTAIALMDEDPHPGLHTWTATRASFVDERNRLLSELAEAHLYEFKR